MKKNKTVWKRAVAKDSSSETSLVRFVNFFFGPLSQRLLALSPFVAQALHRLLLGAGFRVVSVSYLSIALFSFSILLVFGTIFGILVYSFLGQPLFLLSGLVFGTGAVIIFLAHPFFVRWQRHREMERELPFFILHLSTLADAQVNDLALFRALLPSFIARSFRIELRRIITLVTVFRNTVPQAIRTVAETVPSHSAKMFFHDFANAWEKEHNPKRFLDQSTTMALKRFETSMYFREKVHLVVDEIKLAFHTLHFHKWSICFLIPAIILFVFAFTTLFGSFDFTLFFVIGLFFLVFPFLFSVLFQVLRNRALEQEFFLFSKELSRKGDLLKVSGSFPHFAPHLKKMHNQYRLGIPLERVFRTLSYDLKHPMLRAAVLIALEMRLSGVDVDEALEKILAAKLRRSLVFGK